MALAELQEQVFSFQSQPEPVAWERRPEQVQLLAEEEARRTSPTVPEEQSFSPPSSEEALVPEQSLFLEQELAARWTYPIVPAEE